MPRDTSAYQLVKNDKTSLPQSLEETCDSGFRFFSCHPVFSSKEGDDLPDRLFPINELPDKTPHLIQLQSFGGDVAWVFAESPVQ